LRPQRYAFELVTDIELPSSVKFLHRSDVPLCVHAALDAKESYVRSGTDRENMLDRSERGRHENRWTVLGYRGWRAKSARVDRAS
jgi:hypothetical protein